MTDVHPLDPDVKTALEQHPASVKLVYTVLGAAREDELTQAEIANRSLLTQRTVREALYVLEEDDLVERRVDPRDLRQKLYKTVK